MNATEDARSSLDQIAARQQQAVEGAARGRHRGWDAAGLLTGWAGFAAMDLPLPESPRLVLFGVAAIAALVCFTLAGMRGRALVHSSQLSRRHRAVLIGLAAVSGAVVMAAIPLLERIDLPLRNTILGLVLVILVAGPAEWVHRASLRRTTA